MHKTLKDFLAAEHKDETDKLAQRALKVLTACGGDQGYIANAYHRGDGDAYAAVSRAHYEATVAFVLINETKTYPFAAEVLAGIVVQHVQAEEPAAAAAYFVGIAETAVDAYAERCRPVCRIIGDVGVTILRGFHAAEAMKDVRAANAA